MTIEPGWCEVEPPVEGVAVLRLYGEHDLGTVTEVTSAFESLSTRECDVVLDLSRTVFLDSAVLHAIYRFAGEMSDRGRRLALQIGPESIVHRALEVAALLDTLPWAEDREEAIALAQGR